ncbi:MAG: hypothetical protein DDG59_15285 [Anaerolineae bacterium]|jgi:hypothetical protein|nr:MAG: hypothetical protein DDG59_15285 [Anaerolineae bacterium]
MILDLPYQSEVVKQRVIAAIARLYRHDPQLLEADVNERTITHKLAEYFQDEFPEWHVDCEYNRRGDQVKRLRLGDWRTRPDDMEAKTVFPDIIVHRRGTDYNLVVIEVKKSSGGEETKDLEKLQAFIEDPAYRYQFGLFLRIGPLDDLELRLFTHGKQVENWTEDLQQALGAIGYGGW